MEAVLIDGSFGEGGGQILRTALVLSCITGRRLQIENIRAARRKPGLARQHLVCVQAACGICDGRCEGAALGSKELDFQPGRIRAGEFYFDIGSAGSALLVIQTILPALFLADKPSKITVVGGTHNPLAPPFNFLLETFLPAIAGGGFRADCKLVKHGFYPAGGGKIIFDVQPWQKQTEQKIDICERSGPMRISAKIYTARLSVQIAERQRKLLMGTDLDIQDVRHIEVMDSDGPGNCVMICIFDGRHTTVLTSFGERGKPSHKVVGEVAGMAKDFLGSGAAIDKFLADQLLAYMALSQAGAYTTSEISLHLQTNMEVIKKFLPVNFDVQQEESSYKVLCRPVKN